MALSLEEKINRLERLCPPWQGRKKVPVGIGLSRECLLNLYAKVLEELEMTVQEHVEEDGLRPTIYPKMRVLTGGKGPPEPPADGINWLAEQVCGTTFVARHQNSKDVDYNLYYVLFMDLPKVVLLKWQLPDGKVLDYYVDPERFSKKFSDYVILGVNKPIEIGTEEPLQEVGDENDGNSDRSD